MDSSSVDSDRSAWINTDNDPIVTELERILDSWTSHRAEHLLGPRRRAGRRSAATNRLSLFMLQPHELRETASTSFNLKTEPFDPLDGEGSVPPGDPDPQEGWVSPSTLGNGLVHDTRSEVDPNTHASAFTNAELEAGAAWSDFVSSNTAMLGLGFRPAQVDAVVGFTRDLQITDQTLYISDDDANYRTEIFTHAFTTLAGERVFDAWQPVALGARPTSIHAFAEDGRVGYSVAWVYDSATTTPTVPWVLKAGQSAAEMTALLADADLRPISLSSRRRSGTHEYAAIFVPTDSPANWAASLSIQSASLASEIAQRWQDGFYAYRISAEEGDSTRVNVLWAQRPPGIAVQTRLNLTDSAFEDEDAWWRSHGYHLETTDRYVQGGEQRRAAVWVHYEPYLRWRGNKFVPGDATYETRYKMFHDQALRRIASLTEIDCSGGQPCPTGTFCRACPADYPCFHDQVCVEDGFGNFTRPSASLHIFEGPNVVLNRAYTFAPSIYPDTPLNASFKGGSTAKSLTAVAVVREVNLQGLTLNSSFKGVAGVAQDYPQIRVRIRDVLENLGGFAGSSPASYLNHSMIVAAGATAPVDGKELFEYVFAPPPNGHIDLGIMDGDSYWQSEWLGTGTGNILYSNVGYSLVGELVRIKSGVPYDEYVTSNLLVPLGLEDRIYPDPGSRVRTRGPTLATVGTYLVDTDHPYNVGSPNPTQPQVGLVANPVVTWESYIGPDEPRAPARATGKYGGGFYLGGGPLPAGGWWADGEALGTLIRTISRSELLLPQSQAVWLWHPALQNYNHGIASGWGYVHGWYVRGNWVAWMGSDEGAIALTMHNRMYDVTVVFLANGFGSPANFITPLMASPDLVQGSSQIGQVWPCIPDPSVAPTPTCNLPVSAVY